ncbi:MAG: PilZ domain-containing protein [Deltaproteobacteria bacterium]|nr:PilZ domain-containing protein [Deltaproteobacteria bacterium]
MATVQSKGGNKAGVRDQRHIVAPFANWDDFLGCRLDVMPAGLFLAGAFPVEVGQEIEVRCTFPGDADGVRLGGRVLWRRMRAGSDPNVRAGIGVVLRSTSMTAFRRLVEQAEGRVGLAGRRQERFALRIPVACTFGRRRPLEIAGEISDVSPRGAAVHVAHRPAVGDAVFLRLDDRLLGTIELAGFVTWVRPGGPVANGAAIGVELQFPRDEDRKAWDRIVGRAKADARLSQDYSDEP